MTQHHTWLCVAWEDLVGARPAGVRGCPDTVPGPPGWGAHSVRAVLRVTCAKKTEMVVNRAYSGEIKCRLYRMDLLCICPSLFQKGMQAGASHAGGGCGTE